jgi:hypothetical protein
VVSTAAAEFSRERKAGRGEAYGRQKPFFELTYFLLSSETGTQYHTTLDIKRTKDQHTPKWPTNLHMSFIFVKLAEFVNYIIYHIVEEHLI